MPERFYRKPESLSEKSQSQMSIATNMSSDTDSGIQHFEELRQLSFKNSASQNPSGDRDFAFKKKGENISSSEEEIFYSTEETQSRFAESKLNDEKKGSLKTKWLRSVDRVTLDIIQVSFLTI